eukprot:1195356-Prorocentrum_minimum.AAC.10
MLLVFFTFSRVPRLAGVYTRPILPLLTPSRPPPDDPLLQGVRDGDRGAGASGGGRGAPYPRRPPCPSRPDLRRGDGAAAGPTLVTTVFGHVGRLEPAVVHPVGAPVGGGAGVRDGGGIGGGRGHMHRVNPQPKRVNSGRARVNSRQKKTL